MEDYCAIDAKNTDNKLYDEDGNVLPEATPIEAVPGLAPDYGSKKLKAQVLLIFFAFK